MSQCTTPLLPHNGSQVKSITILIGTSSHKIPPSSLTTASARQLAGELAAEPPGPVVMSIAGVVGWLFETVVGLFTLWATMRATRTVTVKFGKDTHTNPLPVLFAVWDAASNGGTAERMEEAVDLVSRFVDPSDHLNAADAIATALADPGISAQSVLAKIAVRVRVADSKGGKPNPTLLARDFLAYHRTTVTAGSVSPDDRTVHYFNGTFYLWNQRWVESPSDDMRAIVVKFLQNQTGVEAVTSSLVNNVLLNLQGECLVGPSGEPQPFFVGAYGPPPIAVRRQILAVANGLLDFGPLAEGEDTVPPLLDHTPRWFSTVATLPFSFDPTARCPKFGQFLRQVFECPGGVPTTSGDNRIALLQEWFGYTLHPDGRFQKFLLMFGEGNNGKGVIQNLWVRMLGAENVAHVSLDQLGGRFALQPLLGKLANICGDLCEIDTVAEGMLKRLTGGDNITVDRKNLTPVTMAPNVKLVFATNALPRFSDRSRGVWRRLIAMPFRVSVAEADQNPNLTEELNAELPGILRWAIAGLRRLLRQGHFSVCTVCATAARDHQTDCDPVRQFIDEVLEYPPPPGGPERCCPVDEVYGNYKTWSESNGFKTLSKNRFNRQIAKLDGVTKVRRSGCNVHGKRPYYWYGFGKPSPEALLLAMSQNSTDDELLDETV